MNNSEFKSLLKKAQKSSSLEALLYFEKIITIAHKLSIKDFENLVMALETKRQVATSEHLKNIYQYQIWSAYGQSLYSQQKFEEALVYFENSQNIAVVIEDNQLLAKAKNNLGIVYYQQGNYIESFTQYKSALTFIRNLKTDELLGKSLLNLGLLYKQQEIYDKAVECLLEGVSIVEQEEKSDVLAACYNAIANIYMKLENYDTSLAYHEEALALRKKLGNKIEVAKSLNNIGMVYLEKKNYLEALQYFKDTLKVKGEFEGDALFANILSNLGRTYHFLQNLKEAELYHERALIIRRQNNQKGELATSLIDLGRLCIEQQQFEKAEEYLEEADLLVNDIQNKDLKADILDNYTNLYELNENYELALKTHRNYHHLMSEISDEKMTRRIMETQMRYETEKREQEIAFLRKQNDLKTFLMRELHHRVKNNLQILSSLLSLQSNQLIDKTAKSIVKEGENRVRAMSLVHQELYNEDDIHVVNMAQYIKNLTTHLKEAYGFVQREVSIHFDISYTNLEVDKAIPLALIINEIVSNAFKHAFKDVKEAKLEIKLYEPILNEICLEVMDNGKGIPDTVDIAQTSSFGLRLINMLAEQLKGDIKLDRKYGTNWRLQIPI